LVERSSDLGEGDEPNHRIYDLTDSRREALRAWFASGIPPESQREEFFVKLMVALASGEADPACIVQTRRAHLYQELHAVKKQCDRYDPRAERRRSCWLTRLSCTWRLTCAGWT